LDKDSLILSENSSTSSSVNFDLESPLCNSTISSNLDLINLPIKIDQSIFEVCLTNISSSGILTTISSIDKDNDEEYINLSDFENNEIIYFLDENNIASIDDKGDLFLLGTLSQSQGVLSPTANSFILQDSAGQSIAFFNSTGSLFLAGTISTSSDLTGLTSTNLEIRNSTDDLVAFFDNQGNLHPGVYNRKGCENPKEGRVPFQGLSRGTKEVREPLRGPETFFKKCLLRAKLKRVMKMQVLKDKMRKLCKNDLVGVVVMPEFEKDDCFVGFINSETKNETFEDMDSLSASEVVPEVFVTTGIENNFINLSCEGFFKDRIFPAEFINGFLAVRIDNGVITHFLNSSSAELNLMNGPSSASSNSLRNNFFIGNSSTGCQSIASQNSQSSSVISRVCLNLADMSCLTNSINALPNNLEDALVCNSSGISTLISMDNGNVGEYLNVSGLFNNLKLKGGYIESYVSP